MLVGVAVVEMAETAEQEGRERRSGEAEAVRRSFVSRKSVRFFEGETTSLRAAVKFNAFSP